MEMAFRGRSHWTMFILGAICFILLGLINELLYSFKVPPPDSVVSVVVDPLDMIVFIIC